MVLEQACMVALRSRTRETHPDSTLSSHRRRKGTWGVVFRGIWDSRPTVIGTGNLLKVLWIWRVQWMLILRCYRG
jgi:hypothetical protein